MDSHIYGQNFKFNPTEKVAGCHHQYYIGTGGGSYFVLICNEGLRNESPHDQLFSHEAFGFTLGNKSIILLKYDTGFHIAAKKEIKFGKKMGAFINGVASDKNIYLFYMGKPNSLYADVLSLDGTYIETKTIREGGTEYDVVISPDGKKICVNTGAELIMMDNDLKETLKKPLPGKQIFFRLSIDNNGELMGNFLNKNRILSVIWYDPQSASLQVKDVTFKQHKGYIHSFIIKRNKDKLYILGLNGESYKNIEKSFAVGSIPHSVEFSATGYEIHILDTKTMNEQSSMVFDFPEETIKKFMEHPDKDKLVGIDGLQFQNVYFTIKDELILVAQASEMIESETIETSYGSHVSQNTSTSYKYHDGNIMLVKADSKGQEQKTVVMDRKINVPAEFVQLTSMSSFWKNGNLYLVYNHKGLTHCRLNSDLQIEESADIKTYKIAEIQVNSGHSYWLSENKYLMTGNFNKNLGSVILTF
jgi:hypothetical protein